MKDDWLCCKDVVDELAAGCRPQGSTIRIYVRRETAIEHFFVTSFAIPLKEVCQCLLSVTHEEEMRCEKKRNHIRLLQPENSRFLSRKFADQFGLHFYSGTCRDEDGKLVAHHYVEKRAMFEYVDIDVPHLVEFLRTNDHALIHYTSVVRHSERRPEELDSDGLACEKVESDHRFTISVETGAPKFRMNTAVRLLGKTVVRF
ncbi:MAG: hypothetical protein V1876_03615 [Candidatus Peregrinibacteria bacterium]